MQVSDANRLLDDLAYEWCTHRKGHGDRRCPLTKKAADALAETHDKVRARIAAQYEVKLDDRIYRVARNGGRWEAQDGS